MKITKRIGAALTVAVLALGTFVLGTAPASAHTPNASITCTTWSVSATQYERSATAVVTLDGVVIHQGTFGGNLSLSGTFEQGFPRAAEHRLQVTIDSTDGNGRQYDFAFNQRVTGCNPSTDITVPQLSVTPPTCTADGTLPFLSNPPAQNPNGYEFPGQGFRVYLDRAYAGPGTYVATLQKIGANFDPAFPGGTRIIGGSTSQTLVVLPATGFQNEDGSAPCFVPQPDALVEVVEVYQPAVCEAPGQSTVIERGERTITTTPYVFDPSTGTYTLGEPMVVTEPISRTRDLTEQERIDCAGPQPDDFVAEVPSEWFGGVFECGDTEVTETRTITTTTTPYVLNEDYVWVAGEGTTVVTEENRTRPLTEDELADQAEACTVEPPVTEPPTTEPPATEPPTTVPPTAPAPTPVPVVDVGSPGTPQSLPQTGSEGGFVLGAAALALIALGALTLLVRKTRSQR